MTHPIVRIDLESDYLAWLRGELRKLGVPIPADTTTVDKLSYIYWNARKRHIPARRRRIHVAREFRSPSAAADRDGLATLLGMFEQGIDVNPRLSRYAKSPKPFPKREEKYKADPFHDGLLNHWGIQHFHWDDGSDESMRRSSMMLFAVVRPDDVYAIDVLGHGLWSRQDLVERVHSNWPFLLQQFRQPSEDGDPGASSLTDQEIATLRRKGYSVAFVAKDGTEYFPPGGGQVAAGIGLDVVMHANRAAGIVSHWNALLKEDHELIPDFFARYGAPVPDSVVLKLRIDDTLTLHVFEPTYGFTITLGPLFPTSSS